MKRTLSKYLALQREQENYYSVGHRIKNNNNNSNNNIIANKNERNAGKTNPIKSPLQNILFLLDIYCMAC